jgi:hypothetical protein
MIDRQIIFRKEDIGHTMRVPLSNSSKEMVFSGAESCGGIHNTSDARTVAVVKARA